MRKDLLVYDKLTKTMLTVSCRDVGMDCDYDHSYRTIIIKQKI